MSRLATPDYDRLETTASLDVSIGGTESNVAVALARLGRQATWISALPTKPPWSPDRINTAISRRRTSTRLSGSTVVGSRASTFLEPGDITPRPTRVIYDRAGSALATIDPEGRLPMPPWIPPDCSI